MIKCSDMLICKNCLSRGGKKHKSQFVPFADFCGVKSPIKLLSFLLLP